MGGLRLPQWAPTQGEDGWQEEAKWEAVSVRPELGTRVRDLERVIRLLDAWEARLDGRA